MKFLGVLLFLPALACAEVGIGAGGINSSGSSFTGSLVGAGGINAFVNPYVGVNAGGGSIVAPMAAGIGAANFGSSSFQAPPFGGIQTGSPLAVTPQNTGIGFQGYESSVASGSVNAVGSVGAVSNGQNVLGGGGIESASPEGSTATLRPMGIEGNQGQSPAPGLLIPFRR